MKTLAEILRQLLPRPVVWWTLFGLWLAVVCLLSSLPGNQIPNVPVPHWDKPAHFILFLGGGLSLALALPATFPARGWWPVLLLTLLFTSLFGALDEWRQLQTPMRHGASFGDWIADTLGGAAGAFTAWFLHFFHERGKLPSNTKPTCQDPAP